MKQRCLLYFIIDTIKKGSCIYEYAHAQAHSYIQPPLLCIHSASAIFTVKQITGYLKEKLSKRLDAST